MIGELLELHRKIEKLESENKSMKAKSKILEDALEFYAKQSSWIGYHEYVDTILDDDGFSIQFGGKRARQALEQFRKEDA